MASDIPSLRVNREDRVSLEGGVLVLGAIASGKTSATAATILRRLLADPRTGMLLLTAHPEEAARILGYIRDAGREHDLLRFSRHRFNALEWGRRMGYSVEDLTALLMQALEVSGRVERSAPQAQDSWIASMQSLVRAAIQLLTLGQDFLSLYDIHRVLISAPADARDPHRPSWQQDSFCYQLIVQARQRVARSGHPLAQHDLRMVEDYFLRFWATLNPRTKTTVVSVFQAFASPFLYGELFQRCCTGVSIDPRATHGGKIILMDTPAESSESNLVMQTLMKTCWQLATRRRRLTPHSGMAVCYADEAALYATSGDGPFLAIARNRKATMVYIGHAIPEFAEKIGQQRDHESLFALPHENLSRHQRPGDRAVCGQPDRRDLAAPAHPNADREPHGQRGHESAMERSPPPAGAVLRLLLGHERERHRPPRPPNPAARPGNLTHRRQSQPLFGGRDHRPIRHHLVHTAETSSAPPSARTSPAPAAASSLSSAAESLHPA